ncbi:MAG: methionyl-tRNA formyltransferase [Minisyncoccia bacterium]
MRYIFFGSSEFAKIILQELLESDMKPLLVITQPPKPKGRKQILSPTPVQLFAEQNKLPVLTPENLNNLNFLKQIEDINPNFILLTAYGKIIPSSLIKLPPFGFLNLHPSLLPKWRGATPIQSAILEGETETGVTLFKMDEQIDHGPIIQYTVYRIQYTRITYLELSQQLAQVGANLIIKTLPQWLEGKIIPQPQNEQLATYCHKITPEDEKINWQTSAEEVDRKVRALNPSPGTYTIIQDKILKIISGSPFIDNSLSKNKKEGEIFETSNHKIAIQCHNSIYQIDFLKPAGKNIMTSQDFLRGNQWVLGQIIS